jgi:hypothetical protein
MKNRNLIQFASTAIAYSILLIGSAYAEVTEEVLKSIRTPDRVETSIGTLIFIDGAPMPETATKVYDHLDTMRGVDAFLKGMPGASVHALVRGVYEVGAVEAHQVMITDQMMDSTPLFLTGNTTTMYAVPTLDLERDGPTVLEIPAGMLGMFDDAWFRYLEDIGPLGPDKGKGGKFLALPPGYKGTIPEGYFVVRSTSYEVLIILRTSIAEGIDVAAGRIKDGLKIYPLSKQNSPPEMEFISGSGKSFNTIHANNFKFYEEVNEIIQKEPLSLLDPEIRGLFASIGIAKGTPFDPDSRMKRILVDAIAIGNATARSIVWYPRTEGTMKGIKTYSDVDSSWQMGWVDKNVFFNGKDGNTMNSDARVMFHYPFTGVTPAMAVSIPGKGSDYAIAFLDSNKLPFDGFKTYKLHIPANPPVNNFWSVTVYDSQTRSQLQTSQPFPALDSVQSKLKKSADGSYDLYFAPKAPNGMETNWLQTIPGKSFFVALRMYGPLTPWIDKSWIPGEVELIE